MRSILMIVLFVMFTGGMLVSVSVRADEYGDRFYNQTPKGLAEFDAGENEIPNIAMDDAAAQLQEIMPAAGDDADEDSSDATLKVDNSDNQDIETSSEQN